MRGVFFKKFLFAAFLPWALIVFSPRPAANAEPIVCPPYPEPFIEIIPIIERERIDSSLHLQQIRAMAGQGNPSYAGMKELPVGLTASNLRLDTSFEILSRPVRNGPAVCSRISRLELRIGFVETTVFIASEVPQPSCGFDAVMEHEGRHVAVDRNLLAATLPRLPGLLAGELRRTGTVQAGSAEDALAYLRHEMNAFTRAFAASLAAERERLQKQIDSHEEYRRLTMSCGGELARLSSAPGR